MSQKQLLFDLPIPDGWRVLKVDQIKADEPSSCSAGPFGSNISSKYFADAGVPVIRGANLRDDLTRFVPKGFVFVSEERAKAYKGQHVRAGDLVFTCWGTLGQVGLIPDDGPYKEYIISNKQLKLRPNRSLADPLYLFYYFASPEMVKHIRSIAIGAAVPGINLGLLKNLDVTLPALVTQERIVAVLSAYDNLIENNTRRIAILESMAQSLYREWFVRFRFPGHEDIPLVPSPLGATPHGWSRLLGEVLTLKRGYDLPQSRRNVGNIPIVSSSGITDFHDEAKVRGPGVVTGRYGTLGEVFYVPDDFWPLNTSLYVQDFRGNDPHLVVQLLRTLNLARQNAAGAVPGVNRNALHMLRVSFPPIELQRRIVPTFQGFHECAWNLQKKNENLRKTRDLLLPKLISGQLDVEHLDIEYGISTVEAIS
jgi:type I restriction enzyme, S subunit